jgi:hypothetical protein
VTARTCAWATHQSNPSQIKILRDSDTVIQI